MREKIKNKGFIISVIGRDFRKTPESEEKPKDHLKDSASSKENTANSQTLKKDRTHYRIEYTKDGPKLWTLH